MQAKSDKPTNVVVGMRTPQSNEETDYSLETRVVFEEGGISELVLSCSYL